MILFRKESRVLDKVFNQYLISLRLSIVLLRIYLAFQEGIGNCCRWVGKIIVWVRESGVGFRMIYIPLHTSVF